MSEQPEPSEGPSGRHASWLELFFDLVVVVAVAQLAHRLQGHEGSPGWQDVLVFAVLYFAVWLVWSSFTMYANVAAEKTRQRSMLIGMLGIAVMAVAIPEATGERSTLFAAAFVFTRVAGMRTWGTVRQILTSWPVAQNSAGLVPWIISLWMDQPTQLYLWAFGLAIDLWFSFGATRDPDELIKRFQKREEDQFRRNQQRLRRGDAPEIMPQYSAASLDAEHLGERLGLFVIIVLGEAMLQLVTAASEGAWDNRLVAVGAAGFGLLVGVWWLTFQYGFGEKPDLPPRLLMPAHFLLTAAIAVVAAGLGVLTQHAHGHTEASGRWLVCAGLAIYLAISAILSARVKSLWIALLIVGAAVALAPLGGLVPPWLFAWGLAACVGAQVLYLRRFARPG
ncbi:low temperature requirement protein A [Flindersiella endophytica]